MKTKKMIKILTAILMVIMLCSIAMNVLAAAAGSGIIAPSELNGSSTATGEINNFGNIIIGIIQAVGSVIAVVILLVLGIKYMTGSAEEKAEYKKTMLPYIIGAIFIFAASNIVGVIYSSGNAISINKK